MITHLVVDFGTISYWKLFSLVSKGKGYDDTTKNIFLVKESEEEFPNWCNLIDAELVSLINRFNPDKMTIACDGKYLWRKKFYPAYKANRKKQRAEVPIDWDLFGKTRDNHIKGLSKILPIKALLLDGIEADDIIAVLTKRLHEDENIIAVTGDGDINQLFRFNNFTVYDPKNNNHIKYMDWMDVLNVKVLSGDRGDNIDPLRPRLGPATARKIINECEGNLEEYCKENGLLDQLTLNQKLINFEMIPTDIQNYIFSEYKDAKIIRPDHSKMVMNFSADYSTILDLFNRKLFKNAIS